MPWQKRYHWDLDDAHEHCSDNRSILMNDTLCGCFYCGIDSIIPQSAGFPLNEEFLRAMRRRWFETGNGIRLSIPPGDIFLTLDGKEKISSMRLLTL